MGNYQFTTDENYDEICKEMKKLADELEQNINMPEDRFRQILERHRQLGRMLEEYGKKKWEN